MSDDSRDQLWNATFETYYDCFYHEITADKIVSKWQWLDEISKILIAATASGSAVSGWVLWNTPTFKPIWLAIAGVGAVLAIIHTTLSVPNRLKEWGDSKREFANLRIGLETLKYRMAINSEFLVDDLTGEFLKYRESYSHAIGTLGDDILRTRRLENSAQNDLDKKLGITNS